MTLLLPHLRGRAGTRLRLRRALMLYWQWRLGVRQTLHGSVTVSAPRTDALEQF